MGSSRTNKQRTPVFGVSSTPVPKTNDAAAVKISPFQLPANCFLCPLLVLGPSLLCSWSYIASLLYEGEMEESCSLRRSTCGLGSRRSLVPPTLPCSWSPWIGHDRQGTSEASQAANWSECLTRWPIRHRCFVAPQVLAHDGNRQRSGDRLTTRCSRPTYHGAVFEGESFLSMR
jgi:hypothetical protein